LKRQSEAIQQIVNIQFRLVRVGNTFYVFGGDFATFINWLSGHPPGVTIIESRILPFFSIQWAWLDYFFIANGIN
jgi:hypothetical protein